MIHDLGIKEELRHFLGREKFQSFYFAIQNSDRLYFWQERIIEKLSLEIKEELPTNIDFWKLLLKDAIVYSLLLEKDVPSYIEIDSLTEPCPVQGEGKCYGYRWYFRARWDGWELYLSYDPKVEPLDIEPYKNGYIIEDIYGDCKMSAGYMLLDEARYFIVSSLTSLVNRFNLKC